MTSFQFVKKPKPFALAMKKSAIILILVLLSTVLSVADSSKKQKETATTISARTTERWEDILIDMEELDVVLTGLEVRMNILKYHSTFEYTATYKRDENSWKSGQPDYNPKYFKFNLPATILANNFPISRELKPRNLNPADFNSHAYYNGIPIQSLKILYSQTNARNSPEFPDLFRIVRVTGNVSYENSDQIFVVKFTYDQFRSKNTTKTSVFGFELRDITTTTNTVPSTFHLEYMNLTKRKIRENAWSTYDENCDCFEADLSPNTAYEIHLK